MNISFWDSGTRIGTWPDDSHTIPRVGDYILLTKGWKVNTVLWVDSNTVRLGLVEAKDP
jgi:hypothetical protein